MFSTGLTDELSQTSLMPTRAEARSFFALYTVSPIFDLRSNRKSVINKSNWTFHKKGAENTMALRKIVTVGDLILTKVCCPASQNLTRSLQF